MSHIHVKCFIEGVDVVEVASRPSSTFDDVAFATLMVIDRKAVNRRRIAENRTFLVELREAIETAMNGDVGVVHHANGTDVEVRHVQG